MAKSARLPARDPFQLHLQYLYDHGLHDDPHGQTVQEWEITEDELVNE
ncbi:hypothetical protein [Streptomyces werraensis]